MTKTEWWNADDPRRMIQFVRARASSHKLRLFAVAALRRVPGSTCSEDEWDRVLECGDRYAAARVQAENVLRAASIPSGADVETAVMFLTTANPVTAALLASDWAAGLRRGLTGEPVYDRPVELPAQAALLREIFGNPFRAPAFRPEWRTDTAVAVAQQIYSSRDFSALPILADALQDAGCDNDDLLQHCRCALPSRPFCLAEPGERDEKGEHVRGCWAVDLVLGNE